MTLDTLPLGYLLDHTGTELLTLGNLQEHPAQWVAIKAWCVFHDMDPRLMPVNNAIARNVALCRVEYDEIVLDHDTGRRVITDLAGGERGYELRRAYSQGEAPPLPFPALLLRTSPAFTQGDPA